MVRPFDPLGPRRHLGGRWDCEANEPLGTPTVLTGSPSLLGSFTAAGARVQALLPGAMDSSCAVGAGEASSRPIRTSASLDSSTRRSSSSSRSIAATSRPASFATDHRLNPFGARRLTIQSFIDGPVGFDFLKCQTFAASPAEPGELPFWFSPEGGLWMR